jgi:hypothetical protein
VEQVLADIPELIEPPHPDPQNPYRDNTIGHSPPSPAAGPGIRASQEATGLKAEANRFLHVKTPHVKTPIEAGG